MKPGGARTPFCSRAEARAFVAKRVPPDTLDALILASGVLQLESGADEAERAFAEVARLVRDRSFRAIMRALQAEGHAVIKAGAWRGCGRDEDARELADLVARLARAVARISKLAHSEDPPQPARRGRRRTVKGLEEISLAPRSALVQLCMRDPGVRWTGELVYRFAIGRGLEDEPHSEKRYLKDKREYERAVELARVSAGKRATRS